MSEVPLNRTCKGICKQYWAKKPSGGIGRYASGQVRCMQCNMFITREGCNDKFGNPATENTEGLFCKCCGYRVRSLPRNRVYKEKYHQHMSGKDLPTVDTEPMDIDELKNFVMEEIRPQANYQFVVIKTLLELENRASREQISQALEFYNRDKPSQDHYNSIVFSVLEGRNIIFREPDNYYHLNIEQEQDLFDVLDVITICNKKIYENKLNPNPEYFIALGPWENWNHTIENMPIRWGVAETTASNTAVFNLVTEGDIVFYYSTKDEPTYYSQRGFFGVGIVTKKTIDQTEMYWPEEQRTNKAFYTHKIFLDTLKFAQVDEELLPLVEGLPLVKGLNHITAGEALDKLIENTRTQWNVLKQDKPAEITNYWKIAPGESAEYWDEQRDAGVIGIGWNELGDLTGKDLDWVHNELRRIWPSQIAVFSPQFRDFLSIKKGDIIIANKGLSKIVGIGRVTGNYQYRPNMTSHHTYPVEWFDTTFKEIPGQGITWRKTVYRVSEELYNSITSGQFPENTLSDSENEETSQTGTYLLLRHNPSFKRKKSDITPWNDKLGREYHYGKTVANYTKIASNSKTVWFFTDKDNLYFWGFGIVDQIQNESDGKFIATLRNFHYFDDEYNAQSTVEPSAIKVPFLIQQQIKKLPSWNPFNSIIEINEHIYDQILQSEHLESTFENQPLPFPSPEIIKTAKDEIKEEILVNDDTLDQITSTLLSGKNILLVGPVGSGKTHLATILPEIIWKEYGGYYSQVYTATADWTTQDVIGGIYPKLDANDQVIYDIQKGCVAETVAQNWLNETSKSKKRILFEGTRNNEIKRYRGVWLVIDEFNRANIDRAFGQLFTALEYKNLQIPTTDKETPYENLLIPEDYRIIGTLNTSDKHFLHTLSDALKRRFAIIDLPVPTYEQKKSELYYVVKKALKDLENLTTAIQVDDSKKEIILNSDPDAIKILETLYLLMIYIREIKPLGTALLISMFRFIITNHTITNNWQKSLDFALTSTILPQLENLPYWTLKVTRSVFNSDPGQFFKNDPEILRDGYENYRTDFEHLYNFLKKIKPIPSGVFKRFRSSSLTEEDFVLLTPWSAEIVRPSLPNFLRGITKLIEQKGFTEESELDE